MRNDETPQTPNHLVGGVGRGGGVAVCAVIGWPWVAIHPGLPQTRTCGITAYGSSVTNSLRDVPSRTRCGSTRSVVVSSSRTQGSMSLPCFPPTVRNRRPLSVFPSLHRVASGAASPASSVLRGRYDFPLAHLSALRCLRLEVVRLALADSLPSQAVPCGGPGLRHPVVQPGFCRTSGGISHVPEQPHCTFALLYDPGWTGGVRPLRHASAVPASHHGENSNRKITFRGSITRL
jgi:hypothetical protein